MITDSAVVPHRLQTSAPVPSDMREYKYEKRMCTVALFLCTLICSVHVREKRLCLEKRERNMISPSMTSAELTNVNFSTENGDESKNFRHARNIQSRAEIILEKYFLLTCSVFIFSDKRRDVTAFVGSLSVSVTCKRRYTDCMPLSDRAIQKVQSCISLMGFLSF